MENEKNERMYTVVTRDKHHTYLKMVHLTRKQIEKLFPKDIFQWISFEKSLLVPKEYMLPKDGTIGKRKKYYLTKIVDGDSFRLVIEISLQKFFHLFPEGTYQILTKKCQTIVESQSTSMESSKDDSTNVGTKEKSPHNTDYNTVPIHKNNDNFSLIFRRRNPFLRPRFSLVA
jgi:hypothetical protein